MKASALKYRVLSWVSGFAMAILLLVPFHALLTVWGSSLFGHYTALRLWKEALLLVCIFGVIYLIATDRKIRMHTISRRLVWLIMAYIGLNLAWALLDWNQHDVTTKAIGYGLIINLRFLAFFLVTWAVALRLGRLKSNWQRLALWPAMGVIGFGLLQIIILPNDFLRHLGYGSATIPAYETINSNLNYVRIASTLRGANPLGAYLLIPLSIFSVLLLKSGRNWRNIGFLLAGLVVLFFSFSRSAWIGALLSLAVILFVGRSSSRVRQYAVVLIGCLVLFGLGMTLGLRHNAQFENFVLHTQTNSAVQTTSNQGHYRALKDGLSDLRHEPLGAGVGTAGPASVYNNKSRIAENYFLQIGQETGVLGLLMFVIINVGVGYLLWLRRGDPLALSLLASLIGLTFINLLSHAWADDTLAYIWWGLAGIAMVDSDKIKKDVS